MGCLPSPPKIHTPAAAPPPPAEGADQLRVGDPNDPFNSRNRGAVGRLALRVGPTAQGSSTPSSGGQ